ncbi:TniQ family protein [Pandoraea pneumonica]|uniref:TniQ family protein n=1 Tax=Pandoraea pneumonica TaxID=2508299 RepID=UPI003CF37CE5
MLSEFGDRCFVRRPRPAHDEHVLSYLLRLGEANGFAGRAELGGFVRYLTAVLERPSELAALARALDVDESVVRQISLRHRCISGFAGRAMGYARRNFFRDPHVAYCPVCVREHGRFKALWNFRAVAVCESHGLWLLERCQRCCALVGWDRPGPTACVCGFELGQARTTAAPHEAVLISRLICACLSGADRGDFVDEQHFCPEARQMSAIDWLAVASFFAIFVDGQPRVSPRRKANLDAEKRATLLAARWFTRWPRNAEHELNQSTQAVCDPGGAVLIASQNLRTKLPARFLMHRSGVLTLPHFMINLIEGYGHALSVYSDGCGVAVNPNRLALGDTGELGIDLSRGTRVRSSEGHQGRNFLPLPLFVRGVRAANIVLYDNREVEVLIGATAVQRVVLVHAGFLQADAERQHILSTEVERFRAWLTSASTVTTHFDDKVSLSLLVVRRKVSLLQILRAVAAARIRLFRNTRGTAKLNDCFIRRKAFDELARQNGG